MYVWGGGGLKRWRQKAETPKGCGYRISHTIMPQGDGAIVVDAWGFRWGQLFASVYILT